MAQNPRYNNLSCVEIYRSGGYDMNGNGTIKADPRKSCPGCSAKASMMVWNEKKGGLFCPGCNAQYNGPFRVKYGKLCKSLPTYDGALDYLYGLRHEKRIGTFDKRDHMSSAPLSIPVLVDQYTKARSKEPLTKHYLKEMERVLLIASKKWGKTNIKAIKTGQIEDFLNDLDLSIKSKYNYCVHLKRFFKWFCRRNDMRMPDFPSFAWRKSMAMRAIISIKTQQEIIGHIKATSTDIKIGLAFEMLTTFLEIRPAELRRITEEMIRLDLNAIVLPPEMTKTKQPRILPLTAEMISIIETMPRGLPNVPFFRHASGQHAGKRWGNDFLYNIWCRTCIALGHVNGKGKPICDLYAGTRHSTISALGKAGMTARDVQQATGHRTSDALLRYLQADSEYTMAMQNKIADIKRNAQVVPLQRVGTDSVH